MAKPWIQAIVDAAIIGVLKLIADQNDAQGVKTQLLPEGWSGVVEDGQSHDDDVTLEVSSHVTITATATVKGADGKTLYTSTRIVRASRGASGNAQIDVEDTVLVKDASGWSFTVAVNGSAIRFTLANGSGTGRSAQTLVGWVGAKLP